MTTPTTFGRFFAQVYVQFLMPSRVSAYSDLIKCGRDEGYEIHSVYSFWQRKMRPEPLDSNSRYLVLRHDVDSASVATRKMWQIHARHQCPGAFFFRLETLDPVLMREIEAGGSTAGYHYEELATYARQKGLSKPMQVFAEMANIRSQFRQNLKRVRDVTGLPIRCVASHGDFVNRKLGVTNIPILQDREFRKQVGVDLEAYDREIYSLFTSAHADYGPPDWWKSTSPFDAMRRGDRVVHVLTHPRYWERDVLGGIVQGTQRAWYGVGYSLRSRKPICTLESAARNWRTRYGNGNQP